MLLPESLAYRIGNVISNKQHFHDLCRQQEGDINLGSRQMYRSRHHFVDIRQSSMFCHQRI